MSRSPAGFEPDYRTVVRGLLLGCLFLLHSGTGLAQESPPQQPAPPGEIQLERPDEREFIVDGADLITPADEEQIRAIADQLLNENATPILVVTIRSMADHGGGGMRIETFARLLFDQWGIGHETLNGQLWNTGILLLVSQNDRKARIELGAGWKRDQDALARQIMDELMVPRFKEGEFSPGILAGVQALDQMARGRQIPRPARPWWHYALIAGFVGLAVFTVVSLIRRGSSGWAWLLWGVVFSVVGYLLYSMLTNQGRSGSDGGFSGGSFGGGFSGGGGATGSW